MQFFPLGQYILMAGSNRECVLYTKEGIRLDTIGAQESWVWCAAPRPDSNYVVSGLCPCHPEPSPAPGPAVVGQTTLPAYWACETKICPFHTLSGILW